jgi:hypothetical protein
MPARLRTLRRCALLVALFACSPLPHSAAESARVLSEKPAATLAQLAFLTGTWRGTSSSGATAEEIFSSPEGGVMLSTGREFKNGRCIFFDLVAFTEQNGAVTLIPHPNGKRSPRTFPLVSLDAAAKRVRFENPEHDFPKSFTYELVAPDHLRITLAGDRQGRPFTETFDLRRSP